MARARAPRQRRRDWPRAALFLLPSLALFAVWVFYPLARSAYLGTQQSDLFGIRTEYVGLDQYRDVLGSEEFRNSLWVTIKFVGLTVPTALVLGVGLAVLANTHLRGMRFFRTVFSSTVATSVAVASLLWFVLLQPSVGIINQFLESIGREPIDLLNDPGKALFAVSATTVWQNLGIVFVTVIAGLQSVPAELGEAAAVDGHRAWSRFRRVTLPMLSPTLLFTTTVLTIRAFQTFGEIDLLTRGGPEESTNVLTYALSRTAKTDPGNAAAYAVVLFAVILALTLAQFVLLDRRVHYTGGKLDVE